MKWKFGLWSKVQLERISLLLMIMACKRTAPRHEPVSLSGQASVDYPTMKANFKQGPITDISPNDPQPDYPFLNDLLKYYKNKKDVIYENLKDIKDLLKDIDYKEAVTLNVKPDEYQDAKNDFSALIEASLARKGSNTQSSIESDTLSIFFERDRPDGSWDKRKLAGIESITIKSNPILPNSEKHTFILIAFIAEIQTNKTKTNDLSACVKKGKKWYCYDNDNQQKLPATANNKDPKVELPDEEAIYLASEGGTYFFYQKIT